MNRTTAIALAVAAAVGAAAIAFLLVIQSDRGGSDHTITAEFSVNDETPSQSAQVTGHVEPNEETGTLDIHLVEALVGSRAAIDLAPDSIDSVQCITQAVPAVRGTQFPCHVQGSITEATYFVAVLDSDGNIVFERS